MSKPAAGEVVGEVYAEACDMRVRLYRRQGGRYQLRFSGLGWWPVIWTDPDEALRRLLICSEYGPVQRAMLVGRCRENP